MQPASTPLPMRSIPTRLPVTWGLAVLALVLLVVGWLSTQADPDANTPQGRPQVSRSL